MRLFLSHRFVAQGQEHLETLDFDRALAAYERSIKVDSGYWKPFLGKADVYQTMAFWNLNQDEKREQAARALEAYQASVDRNPYDLEAYFGQSKVHEGQGRTAEAAELFDHILNLAHHERFYLVQAGLQLKRLGKKQEALDLFERAHALSPTDTTRMNIGILRRELAEP
jgi:tetratricopeptide (TPR) repeat protein